MTKTKKANKIQPTAVLHPLLNKPVTTNMPAYKGVYMVKRVSQARTLIANIAPLGSKKTGVWVPVDTLSLYSAKLTESERDDY